LVAALPVLPVSLSVLPVSLSVLPLLPPALLAVSQ
jgi:hypothetical protein